jgi:hypothetical protein
MDESDRQRLIAFVDAVEEGLPLIFDASGQFIEPELHDLWGSAWQAAGERQLFQALRRAIEERQRDAELDNAGLSGPELDLKLAGFQAARDAALVNPTRRLLGRLLAWMDVILDSLIAALLVGEPIGELKKVLETALGDVTADD